MTYPLWPEHPLFAALNRSDAETRLELFDDGLILLSGGGEVLHMTSEAARQLGVDAEASRGVGLSDVAMICQGWTELVVAFGSGLTSDTLLRRSDSREILAVFRPMLAGGDALGGGMIVLRDLNGLDYRRDRANRQASPLRTRFLAENRTRPDFITQRRLAPDLNRLLVRGERAMLQGARILITGESGVGKSEIAKFLHGTVADADAPFVVVNCASSSDALFAKALFGDTGPQTVGLQPGLIEQSEGGTLFLDEVAEIPLSAQALLLRFLEDGLVTRAAGGLQRVANVRVIAATNCDLHQLVREGRFRADLYYRLAVIPLRVPSLREMPALIDHLINRFLQTINQRRQAPVLVTRRVRDILVDYSYPGNIRELLNIVQKLTIFMEETENLAELLEDLLSPIDIPGIDGAPPSIGPASATYDLKTEVRRYERALIDKSIRIHGSKRKAATALGVDIGTIVRKTAEPRPAKEAVNNKTINMGEPKL